MMEQVDKNTGRHTLEDHAALGNLLIYSMIATVKRGRV